MDFKEQLLQRYFEIKTYCSTFSGVNCIAVSKHQSNQKIDWLYEAGHRDFGESYLQEWEQKKDLLSKDIRWHFIGQVQSRKIKPLCEKGIYAIHSIGSESSLEKWFKVESKPAGPCFLQINLEGEEQKGGVDIETARRLYGEGALAGLSGLMTIPPHEFEGDRLRQHFKKMRKLVDEFKLKELSMGMSADWKMAVEEGATFVRIGSGLFGER